MQQKIENVEEEKKLLAMKYENQIYELQKENSLLNQQLNESSTDDLERYVQERETQSKFIADLQGKLIYQTQNLQSKREFLTYRLRIKPSKLISKLCKRIPKCPKKNTKILKKSSIGSKDPKKS
jgi:hypothetical protein